MRTMSSANKHGRVLYSPCNTSIGADAGYLVWIHFGIWSDWMDEKFPSFIAEL